MAEINRISSFKSFTEIRKQENANKLREENNVKRQESVAKLATILDEMGLTSFEGLEEEQKQQIISKIFGDVSEEEIAEIEVEVEEVTEAQVLLFDELDDKFDVLATSISELMDKTEDPKWSKALQGLMNQLEKLISTAAKHDTKLGAIETNESVVTEKKAKFKVGDTTENSIGSEVEIIAIGNWRNISKQFKKEMGSDAGSYGYEDTAKGDYYLAKIVKSEEGDEGDLGIFPVEYDHANYWGLGESLMNEALDIKYKRDAKKVVTQFNKIFAELGSLTSDKGTYLGAIKYLYSEALTDANFHSARSATEKIIKGRLASISVSPESLGKHAIIVGAKNIMKILDNYYSRISNAAGWSGPGIAEGTAMYLESIGEGSTAEKLLTGFNAANESSEYQLSEEEILLKESNSVFEATVEMDAMDPDDKDFLKFLKKNKVKITNKVMDGPGGGVPVITMQGSRKDLEKVLADGEYGWDDPDLAEYIEESVSIVINEGTRGQFGKIDRKGNITSVYTHYDSYPEHMLPIIKAAFKGGKNVDDVIAKGNNSGLEKDINKMNFYNDKSSVMTGSVNKIEDYIKNANYEGGAEYIYLWDEKSKKWMMVDIYDETGLIPAFESNNTEEILEK